MSTVPVKEVQDEEAILNFIFDPNRSFIGATMPQEGTQQQEGAETTEQRKKHEEEREEVKKCKELEKKAVDAAEAGNYDQALEHLSQAESLAPERGSVLNNRAQVLRLQEKYDDAIAELNKAIKKETDWIEANREYVGSSEYSAHRYVLQQAHSQRAAIYHVKGDKEAEQKDLDAAATYGSPIARMATTNTNPYATLCHKAVEQMMQDAFSSNSS